MMIKGGLFGFQAFVNTIINVASEITKTIANMDTEVAQLTIIMPIRLY